MAIARDFPGKLTILVHSMNRGGAQMRLVTIANGLASDGIDVRFVSVSDEGDAQHLLAPEVAFATLGKRRRRKWQSRSLYGLRALKQELTRFPPDLLMAGITPIHGLAIVAAGALPRRPAVVLRASRHPEREISWVKLYKRVKELAVRAIHRRLYDRADLVIAVAEDVATAIRAGMTHPERCVTIRNPVIGPAFLKSLSAPPPHKWFAGDQPVIVAVGRLMWQKGFDELLPAFARLREKVPARLVILGEGKERRALEAQARKLGVDQHVDLVGQVAAVGPWLANADLLVSSSRFEGASAVLVEALAAGCPVVATDCPGESAALLEPVGREVIVPMGQPAAMAAAMAAALVKDWDKDALRRIAAPYSEARGVAAYRDALAALDPARSSAAR